MNQFYFKRLQNKFTKIIIKDFLHICLVFEILL